MNFKWFLWFGLIVISAAGLFLAFRYHREDPTQPSLVSRENKKLTQILNAPRPALPIAKSENAQAPALPAGCIEFWKSLRSLDLSNERFFDTVNLPSGNECEAQSELEKKTYEQYNSACSKEALSVKDEKQKALNRSTCLSAVTLVRVTGAYRQTPFEQIDQLNDIPLLSEWLLASFFEGLSSPEKVKQAEFAAERILKLDPSIYPAAKASFLMSLMEIAQWDTSEKNKSPIPVSMWQKAESKLDRLQRLGNPDTEMEDMELWVRTRNFEVERVKEELQKNIPQHSSANFYYSAYVKTKEKDYEGARAFLREGMKRFPTEKRFEEALATCQKKETPCQFQSRFNFKFDFKDLEK